MEINVVVTSVLASNTAAYLLGGAEQAKSILFYLLKYMTKDSVSLTNSVTVINDALKHVRIHRSLAENSGTSQRMATHFLQRVINSLTGKIELSATQAIAHLLNMPSFLSSTTHCFCFIVAAIAHAKKIKQKLEETVQDSSSDDESDKDSGNSDVNVEVDQPPEKGNNEVKRIGLEDCEETIIPRSVADSSATPRYGSAPVFVIDGKPTPVAHHTHYAFRNVDLQHLSYYEYTGIISVVQKRISPSQNSSSSVNDDLVSNGSADNFSTSEKKGRKRNETFYFDNRHLLHATYTQRLRSLQQTPVLAGGPPPRYPGPRPLNPSKNWLKQADQYACYIMTVFCPWNVRTLLPNLDPTWMGLGEFIRQLNGDGGKRESTFLERSRDLLIQNVTHNLSINSKNKRMMMAWRNKSSTHWNREPNWSGDFQ